MAVNINVGPGRLPTPKAKRDAIPAKYKARAPSREGIEYRYWRLKKSAMRDQGASSTCVGHGFWHNALARPKVIVPGPYMSPRMIYDMAQQRDYWPGAEPDYEGTSVMAGAEAARELGLLTEFHWADDVETALSWLLTRGPLVIGVNWPMSMMMPLPNGFLDISGKRDGSGHCVLIDGGSIKHQHVEGPNSWGLNWGPLGGRFKLRISDFAQLISEDGEICMAVEP